METLTIELPAKLAFAVRKAAAEEAFASPEAFVADLLAQWHNDADAERLEWLRAAIREGDESGPDISLEELDAQLRATIERARAAHA